MRKQNVNMKMSLSASLLAVNVLGFAAINGNDVCSSYCLSHFLDFKLDDLQIKQKIPQRHLFFPHSLDLLSHHIINMLCMPRT